MELKDNSKVIESYKEKARELVSKMTLEEKVSQMLHDAPAIERLGIPAYNWWNEALHGVARAGIATMFPQAIGLAATFDEELMETVGDAVSTEARAKFNIQSKHGDTDIYKGLTMWAPNINIFRDPRWGRGHETYGEDPYLTGRLGARYVAGMQGHDENYMKVAACAKHFAVHSGPEELRHEFDAVVSKQDLYETYLPAFEVLVKEAKVEAVMGAYNRTNGEPCCGSKTLLTDILREEWNFDGHVVSDCWAIKDFHVGHKVTKDEVESVTLAVENGCDINCGNIFVYLTQAVKEGRLSEKQLDEACVRLFTTRFKLGLFDAKDKVPYNALAYDVVDSKKMQELNTEVARKTLVLLKNEDSLLPLDKKKLGTIGVIGPNANSRKALQGNYEGTASRYVTILEGIQDYVGDEIRVLTSEGCHLHKDRVGGLGRENDRISEVKEICELSDVIVACLGLDSGLEGEEGDEGNEFASGDKPNLNLPGLQEELLKTIVASGKPVVLVVLSGSALALNYAQDNVSAILQGWYPGGQGGKAIAQVLFGEYSPEGKLPVTFYKSDEELPAFTDYAMKGRTYRYMENEALYPFGYGLSYSDFEITDAKLDSDEVSEDGVTVTCKLKNNGKLKAAQTVQVYVKANRPGTPNAQLKGLKKITIEAGAEETVVIRLDKKAFSLVNEEGVREVKAGEYTVFVGMSQPDNRSCALMGKKPREFKIVAH